MTRAIATPDPSYDEVMAMRPATKVEPIAIETLELIHPREKIYGMASAIVTIWAYFLLGICLVGLAIAPLALLAGFITAGIHFWPSAFKRYQSHPQTVSRGL